MAILCRVELSEARGKLRGLKIVHPDMGLIMNWGSTLPDVEVRFVPQEMAFKMMADIERVKTQRMCRQARRLDDEEPAASHRPSLVQALHGFFMDLGH